MNRVLAVASVLLALLLTGCGIQRKAAESAMAEVQVTFAGMRGQAMNVAPDEARLMDDALAQAKDDLEKGNFSATLLAAKSLRTRVKDLGDRLPGKQAELEAAWTKLDASVPLTLTALERRIARTRSRPARSGRTSPALSQSELASLTALWSEARSAREVGRVAEAVSKAGDVKYRALRLLDETPDGS